ncbi:hypothetical protein JCM3766R1_002042 [Sporobolomyces carnicolor]
MPPSRRSSGDSSSASSSDGSDDDSNDEPLRKPRTDQRSSSSSTLYFVVGGVIVALAAIAAFVYVVTRSGSSLGSPALSESGQNGAKTSASPSPKSTSSGGGAGTIPPEEEEDDNGQGQGGQGPSAKPSKTSVATSSPASSSSPKPLTGSLSLDFSTVTSTEELYDYMTANGLEITEDFIATKPITHTFYKENIDFGEGALRMRVKGQSGEEDISSSEFQTTSAFLYGSVTTRAKASPVPGVCHGIFWYMNDNLEVDIELLTSYYTEGLGDAVKPGLQLTNQALTPGEKLSNMVVDYGFDPTADYHDYGIEWSETATTFFVDGQKVGQLTENVPREPMKFLWNSWSSGEPNWSAGPPRDDSYFLISAISANWTVVDSGAEE